MLLTIIGLLLSKTRVGDDLSESFEVLLSVFAMMADSILVGLVVGYFLRR